MLGGEQETSSFRVLAVITGRGTFVPDGLGSMVRASSARFTREPVIDQSQVVAAAPESPSVVDAFAPEATVVEA